MCTQEINSDKLTVKENTSEKPLMLVIIVKRKFSYVVERLSEYAALFGCELCGKEYKKKSSMLEHAITHSGEPVNKCDICHHTFNTKTAFRHPLNIHEGKYV